MKKKHIGITSTVIAAASFILTIASAHAQPDQPNPATASSYGMTPGRLVASSAAVLGLVGVVIGGLALVRPAGRFGTASGRLGVIVALAAGLISMAVGGLVVATSPGGFGTGGGLAGAIVAVVLGLIATAVGGLALARSRRTG
ncbi:DUF6223 family protein [Phormidesmis sp. 146-12]